MARPLSEKGKREKTYESLIAAARKNNYTEKFLMDKIDDYMSLYDDLNNIKNLINAMVKNGECDVKGYTNATAEKRQIITAQNRILEFLKIDPDSIMSRGDDADEEL
jgi:hypothetical protein